MYNYKFDKEKIKEELIIWIRDYFYKNAGTDSKAVIGISGGKDSTIVAKLCVEALGRKRIFGVLMPNIIQHDISVSREVCNYLEIENVEINIGPAVESIYAGIATGFIKSRIDFDFFDNKVVTSNTPARIRMTTLYSVAAAIRNGRVSNNSNLSERIIGWTTKWGDNIGDFAPLANLTCSEVIAIGEVLEIPKEFLYKTPEDGLTGFSDEENFGFTYEVLDKFIRTGECEDKNTKEKIIRMFNQSEHKRNLVESYKSRGQITPFNI